MSTTYTWAGGQAGFSGSITLGPASSNQGTIADIVSMSLQFPQPAGSFSYPPVAPSPNAVFQVSGPFAWDSGQITAMSIRWAPNGPQFQNINLGPNKLSDFNANQWGDPTVPNPLEDQTGSWQA